MGFGSHARGSVIVSQQILEKKPVIEWVYNTVYVDKEETKIEFPVYSLSRAENPPKNIAMFGSGLVGTAFTGIGRLPQQLYGIGEINQKGGNGIVPYVNWMSTDLNVGNVKWQLEYCWKSSHEMFDKSSIISAVQAVDKNAWSHQYTTFPKITATDKNIGSYFVFRIFRDPYDFADTYESDAVLLSFGLHYKIIK